MDKQFVTSFWNYVPSGKIDAVKSVDDWADLGMNTPMTCYAEKDEDYEYILKNLDAAAENGTKSAKSARKNIGEELKPRRKNSLRTPLFTLFT